MPFGWGGGGGGGGGWERGRRGIPILRVGIDTTVVGRAAAVACSTVRPTAVDKCVVVNALLTRACDNGDGGEEMMTLVVVVGGGGGGYRQV